MTTAAADSDAIPPLLPDEPAPADGGEKRRVPRVVAAREGVIQVGDEGEAVVLTVQLVDLSLTGCRLVVPRAALPPGFEFEPGLLCELRMRLVAQTVTLPAEVMWAQNSDNACAVVGLRFDELSDATADRIDRFVLDRLRAHLLIPERVASGRHRVATSEEMDAPRPLREPLACEGTAPEGEAYRFELRAVGRHEAIAVPTAPRGQTPRVPPWDALLDLRVHPPAWAPVKMRSLRFVGRVLGIDQGQVRLGFAAGDHDLGGMVRRLLPPERPRAKANREIDIKWVLLALAAVLAYLLVIAGR